MMTNKNTQKRHSRILHDCCARGCQFFLWLFPDQGHQGYQIQVRSTCGPPKMPNIVFGLETGQVLKIKTKNGRVFRIEFSLSRTLRHNIKNRQGNRAEPTTMTLNGRTIVGKSKQKQTRLSKRSAMLKEWGILF